MVNKHVRALLRLALRSALLNSTVLEASSAVDAARHVSAGRVDAIVEHIGRSMTDITRLKQTVARLVRETRHGALTSLPNKNLLVDRLDMTLYRFRREPMRLFGVLLFDLDRF